MTVHAKMKHDVYKPQQWDYELLAMQFSFQ